MLALSQHLLLNNKRLLRVASVSIYKHAAWLIDRARIAIPAAHEGVTLEVEQAVPVGSPVEIALGYDQENHTEFQGYVQRIEAIEDMVYIHVEDAMGSVRTAIGPRQMEQARLGDVLNMVVGISNKIEKIAIDPKLAALPLGRLGWQQSTGLDVLKELGKRTGLWFYSRGSTLFATPRYDTDLQTSAKAIVYDFEKNIETSRLVYKVAQNIGIQAIGIDEKNTRVAAQQSGSTWRQVLHYDLPKVTLERLAAEEYKKWNYEGYTGYLQSWLLPFCSYGYVVKLLAKGYGIKEGDYFVDGVEVHFSKDGGIRKVFLSKKLQ